MRLAFESFNGITVGTYQSLEEFYNGSLHFSSYLVYRLFLNLIAGYDRTIFLHSGRFRAQLLWVIQGMHETDRSSRFRLCYVYML
jgi:hypothetical protein